MFAEANQSTERGFTDTCGDPDQFVQAIGMLSLDRQVRAICMALNATPDEFVDTARGAVLRVVFRDRRTNWGEASYRMVNRDGSEPHYDARSGDHSEISWCAFWYGWMPLLRNRWPRAQGLSWVPYIEYGSLEEAPPAFEPKLTEAQQQAVVAIARHEPVWQVYTNLWEVFALPSNRREMEEYGIAGE